MPSLLHIELLGDFRLSYRDELVTSVDTPRLQSLLAYLVLHRGTLQSRQRIAFAFWPDSTEKQAYNNLRNLLYLLRREWPESETFLKVDTKTLLWIDAPTFTLDVAEFEQGITGAEEALQRADENTARIAFEQAVDLYQGDLLPGCYDEWIFPERERLHQSCTRALERLTDLLETQRDYASAIRHAQHLLRLDPLRETTYRRLMRLHTLNRDRARALRVYQDCTNTLEKELGVNPDPATQDLYERYLTVREEPAAETDPAAPPAAGLPLVGRHEAWAQLQAAWHSAAEGHAHLVSISGEAGIGKTRLAEELLAWTTRQGFATVATQCYAAEGRLAYAPIVEWLRADPLQETMDTLDRVWLIEVARLLPDLQADRPDLPDPESLAESWQRQRLFEALARAVLASGRPLLLFIDDLQWCDRDTMEWLRFLLRFAPKARLLLLGTVRIEEVGPLHPLHDLMLDLGRVGQMTNIVLDPLDPAETRELAAQVAGYELDEAAADWLYQETEGNPLFVVESVRAGLPAPTPEETDAPSARSPLPPTIQAAITKRLMQLAPATQSVAGLAATIGRSFTFEVLSRASFMAEEPLLQALDELWTHRVVRMQENGRYVFTHDKLREASYSGLNPPRRQLLHGRIAEALETLWANDLDAISAQLAHHYDQAGRIERAVPLYRRAAHVAEQVHAHGETIRHLTQARALLQRLPVSSERDKQELDVLTDFGLVLRLAKGHGAPEVGRVFGDAQALCERIGDEMQLFAVQRGLWAFHLIRAELARAQSFGEDLLALADRLDTDGLRLEAGIALGLTHCWRGALTSARDHLERSLTRYDPEQHQAHARRYGQDPGVTGRCVQAFVHALLGAPDAAMDALREALARADALDHPFSRAYALQHAALVHVVLHDVEAVHKQAAALGRLADEYAFAYWVGPSKVLQGWTLAAQGRPAHGRELLQEGLEAHRATEARFESTLWYGLMADACLQAGTVDAGLEHVDTALTLAHETGEHVWASELHRTRGELLVQSGAVEEAAISFRQALDTARTQQARSLELRAAMSQGRLLHDQGRTAEAHRQLDTLLSSLPNEYDTPDLRDARTLLETWT